MRLAAWQQADGRETWGIVGVDGKVWDGGRHTGKDLGAVQAALCADADTAGVVASLGLPSGDTAWDLRYEDLARDGRRLRLPWRPPEVWAAGVTYKASEDARRRESRYQEIYTRVSVAERPELFFKATGDRVRGPGEAIGLRRDSRWQVPEPEVALVLGTKGRIVGFTCGNDMSCRDIEGENPLYLPQAKVYDGACAIGPTVRLSVGEPPSALGIAMRIERAGRTVFEGTSSTERMVRSFDELVDWLGRAYTVLPGTVLLTGTGIVPGDDFTLAEGDLVHVVVDEVGDLVNRCEFVGAARSSGEA